MRFINQYTEDFDRYRQETGTDPFVEYKKQETGEDRKHEIEDWVFSTLRKKNTVPTVKLTDSQEMSEILGICNAKREDVYRGGEFWFNIKGLRFLERFFPEMNDVSKGVGRSHPSINDFFHDDYFLKKAIRKALTNSKNELGLREWILLAGAGFCSNFRPAAAKVLYEMYGKKDCKVLDTSAGYGARLLGAHLSNNVTEYLGIDPNTADSCNKLIDYLDSRFPTNTKKQVLKMGSEDFTKDTFPEYQKYFDLFFTSPPYFDTERYSKDETQSYIKFPSYSKWVKGFYRQTIYNACSSLKTDGVFAINIFEKVPNIKKLTKMFLADCGWYVYHTDKYLLRTMPGSNHRFDENGNPEIRDKSIGSNYEPIWVAKHYTQLLKENIITKEQADRFKNRVLVDM